MMKTSYVRIGGIVWLCAIQYFIVEGIVQHAWNVRSGFTLVYSMRFNYISDLGASMCTYFPRGSSMFVCSPLHVLMNSSFFINGVLTIVGSTFLYRYFKNTFYTHSALIRAGLISIIIGSIGNFGVGLVPETTFLPIHSASAGLIFMFTNIGMILIGLGMHKTKTMLAAALYSIASGTISLIAFLVLVTDAYKRFGFNLGVGLVERFVSYPFTIWLIIMGFIILRASID